MSQLITLTKTDKILPSGSPQLRINEPKRALDNARHYIYQQGKMPYPGSVYKGDLGRIRPLGLLPYRRKGTDVWKELSLLYSIPYTRTSKLQHNSVTSNAVAVISGNVDTMKSFKGPDTASELVNSELVDDEYLNTLAQIDLHNYRDNQDMEVLPYPWKYDVFPPSQKRHNTTQLIQHRTTQLKPINSKHLLGKSNLEYLSFSWQAQLNNRFLTSDARDPLEPELCERCRLRGTRCSRCIAIRTGGGYIILDELASDSTIDYHRNKKDWGYGFGDGLKHGYNKRRYNRTDPFGSSRSSLYAGQRTFGDDDGSGRLSKYGYRGRGGLESDKWDRDSFGNLNQHRSGIQHGGTDKDWRGGNYNSNGRKQKGFLNDDDDISHYNDRERLNTSSSHDNFRGSMNDGTFDHNLREGESSSRLQSSFQRDDSSKQKEGNESDYDDDDDEKRRRRNLGDKDHTNTTLQKQGKSGKRGDGESDDDSEDEQGKKRKKKLRHSNAKSSDNDEKTGSDRDRRKFLGQVNEGDEFDTDKGRSYTDLRRFKSKRDHVKAKDCTLKELQGIDPLDYLAKYCIIDQSKLPHYQQVFDNVDRDEDNLLTIAELDFALKSVNYNLISDNEMEYINSILELSGRYALNFQLFALVAALSERVVALDDMVKRLINSMDFEALETKMKKCKELFYLLANDKEGVVRTTDLAIELHAGGLTDEHVEFVTERLNHEGKGIVQFLDYLTYVPLFVEIHDNINYNPLDFSRTR